MDKYPRASQDLIENGISICYLSAGADIVEAWVRKVETLSEQRVDWGYSCGIANVFFIGDHNKVYQAVLKLKSELDILCIKECMEKYKIKVNSTPAWRLFPPT